jgi:hypothetical protein
MGPDGGFECSHRSLRSLSLRGAPNCNGPFSDLAVKLGADGVDSRGGDALSTGLSKVTACA